jgi:hypothetical protein
VVDGASVRFVVNEKDVHAEAKNRILAKLIRSGLPRALKKA